MILTFRKYSDETYSLEKIDGTKIDVSSFDLREHISIGDNLELVFVDEENHVDSRGIVKIDKVRESMIFYHVEEVLSND